MISFALSLIALVVGYLIYGRYIEKILSPTNNPTPAVLHADGMDYIVMPGWKVFMIQFMNIAGTGPIFGAIMGAWYGPKAYIWIVLGCIFAGAVHDYVSGMMSLRNNGAVLPELVGKYLGGVAHKLLLVFCVLVLMMVGVVFVYSPALILSHLGGDKAMWIMVIFVYYILATMFPVDKIIGKIYPLFAFSLLFMALALLIGLVLKQPALPEWWNQLSETNRNMQPEWLGTDTFLTRNPIFPCLFITIACGAISGFHSTQSPMMARCMQSERQGRAIFYGSMITEGAVALIWAAVSMYFFYYGGWREVVSPEVASAFIGQFEGGKTLIQYFDAPSVVQYVCSGWLGVFGGVLALLGVVAAPITSGDTAFRSARLIIADFLRLEQRNVLKRFAICIPMFLAAFLLLLWQMENPNGFNMIWQYFGWANQTLAVFTLWTATVYLIQEQKNFWVTLLPAVFMTLVTVSFLLVSQFAFGLSPQVSYTVAAVVSLLALCRLYFWYKRQNR